MSSAKLGNQDRPQNGKQVMQAPAWEIGEAGRQVGVPAGPENTDMVCREDFEDWSQEQYNERQLGNLLDYQLMNEMDSARRMEESRRWGHEISWPKSPIGTFREPEYQPHDMVPPVGGTTLTSSSALLGSTPAPHSDWRPKSQPSSSFSEPDKRDMPTTQTSSFSQVGEEQDRPIPLLREPLKPNRHRSAFALAPQGDEPREMDPNALLSENTLESPLENPPDIKTWDNASTPFRPPTSSATPLNRETLDFPPNPPLSQDSRETGPNDPNNEIALKRPSVRGDVAEAIVELMNGGDPQWRQKLRRAAMTRQRAQAQTTTPAPDNTRGPIHRYSTDVGTVPTSVTQYISGPILPQKVGSGESTKDRIFR